MRKPVNQERLLDEIALKVIELDEQKKFDTRLREKIRDHVDTLDELTDLDRDEIEALATRIVSKHTTKPKSVKLAAVISTLILVAAGIFYLNIEDTTSDGTEVSTVSKLRPQYVQEKLALILNSTNTLKVNFLEHWMATGRSPADFEEMGMHKDDFVDGELVKDLIFTDKAIKIFVDDDMGEDIWLKLVPDIQDNRVRITWQCYTNLPQKLLGAKKAALCWSQ